MRSELGAGDPCRQAQGEHLFIHAAKRTAPSPHVRPALRMGEGHCGVGETSGRCAECHARCGQHAHCHAEALRGAPHQQPAQPEERARHGRRGEDRVQRIEDHRWGHGA